MPQTNQTQAHLHGSSVYQGEHGLDQERAASMADEGGVSGAVVDAREQAEPRPQRQAASLMASLRGGGKWWAWAAIGAGLGIIFLFRSRSR